MAYARDLEAAEAALAETQRAYLHRFGWSLTCDFPGALWVWRRDFATEDGEAHDRWVRQCAAEPEKRLRRREPNKHGIVHLPLDAALAVTRRSLDLREEDDQCPICAELFNADDLCATDIELGTCHAGCLEGSPVVDLETGDPIDGEIATFRFDGLSSPCSGQIT